MKKRYVAISLTLGSLALAGGAQADTWDVTQKVTVGKNTTVTQGDGNNAAIQAMNAVNILGALNKTSQKVEMGPNTLKLSQTGATTTTSSQAANYVQAGTISGAFSQIVNSEAADSAIKLDQSAGGKANIQALNMAVGGTVGSTTESFSQDVMPDGAAGNITLSQTTGTGADGSVQAVNYATAETITSLAQNIKTVDLKLGQTGGKKNSQVGNYAKANSGVTNGLSQSAIASGKIDMDQVATGSNNLQAVNAADVASVTGTVTQAATTGATNIDLKQEAQNSSEQAVNYLTSKGTVASVTQNYVNSDRTATLSQDGTESSAQALNFIEMTGGLDVLTKGTQTVTLTTLSLGQGETTANTDSRQAANLLLSKKEIAEASQTVTADIDVTQEEGTGNLQAVNLAAGIAITKLTQKIDDSGKTATLVQDNATTSQQALNAIEMTGGTDKLTEGKQTVTLTTLSLKQGKITANMNSGQAANLLLSKNEIVEASQDVTADIDVTQELGTGNLQAVNSASGKNVTTKLTQTISGDSDSFTQGAEGASNNFQAGNFLDVGATGIVLSVEQNYSAASVTMQQEKITSGVQGLNVIDASASDVNVTGADQNVTVPSLTMLQGQTYGTTKSVQAGNAVITGSSAVGGKVDQDVTVTTLLAMTQANSSTSVQAANFVGNRPL